MSNNEALENVLSHVDSDGKASMVDVSEKAETTRRAVARGRVVMAPETLAALRSNQVKKGDVFAVARVAGIMAAKQYSALIPLCHPLMLDHIKVAFAYRQGDSAGSEPSILIEGSAQSRGATGVEMEALTAVQVAALTIYDMLKAIDKELVITDVHLALKSGGRSGTFSRQRPIPAFETEPNEWF